MTKHSKHFLMIATGLLVVGAVSGSALWADDASKPATTTVKPAAKPKKPAKQLSSDEMAKSAERLVAEMGEALRDIMHLRSQAQDSKDVINLDCVNEQYMIVDQLVNNAEGAHIALGEEIESGAVNLQVQSYNQIEQNASEVQEAKDAAQACLGQTAKLTNNTNIKTTAPVIPHDPTKDGDILGSNHDGLDEHNGHPQLEYVGWASPFAPDE